MTTTEKVLVPSAHGGRQEGELSVQDPSLPTGTRLEERPACPHGMSVWGSESECVSMCVCVCVNTCFRKAIVIANLGKLQHTCGNAPHGIKQN